jgi:hypothetical protein
MKADKNVFPYKLTNSNGVGTIYTGLTARDYIAIQAMTGLSANPEFTQKRFDEIADMAYEQADAMIKRSEVKDE